MGFVPPKKISFGSLGGDGPGHLRQGHPKSEITKMHVKNAVIMLLRTGKILLTPAAWI